MRSFSKAAIATVAGVGLNATDTIIRLPHFPAPDSKVRATAVELKAGGQAASAMVACQRWGLRARYVGKIGHDAAGEFQKAAMEREGVEAHWIIARGCASQTAHILVDERSGTRTVLWSRDERIALQPGELRREWISGAQALLVDGHDTAAATEAASWAREEKIPVVGDYDNLYPGVEVLLEVADFPIVSKEFPERLTGEKDLLKSLPAIFEKFKCHLMAATLGPLGVLAWDGSRFLLCPGFEVKAVDTTGAGDIFHGAFVFGLVQKWDIKETLEFSCAAAALNCLAPGARGGIATLEQIQGLLAKGQRSELAYSPEALAAAARAASRRGRSESPAAARRSPNPKKPQKQQPAGQSHRHGAAK
ncbi:MAG TPA: PfkB family carbohydrate kinase [Candidatus Sulfotelmatobacter sp.]|nr:PfkB family carbohydrate kinase [Candidatus Sulfotelmatobacter sp.]